MKTSVILEICLIRKRLSAYQHTGCNESIVFGKGGKSKPMGPMTLQTELRNIKENGIPIFKHYGEVIEENGTYKTTGMYRTGCALCGFGLEFEPDRFIRLNEIEPARVRFAFRDREREVVLATDRHSNTVTSTVEQIGEYPI